MNKIIELKNNDSNNKEFQIFGVNLYKTIKSGDSVKIVIHNDEEDIYYNKLAKNLGFDIDDNIIEPGEGEIIDITNPEDLESASNNPEVGTININSELSLEKELQFNRPIKFNGNNNKITSNEQGKVLVFLDNSIVEDVNIESTADNSDWHSSYNMQLYTGKHTVKNLKSSGGNCGLLVNGSTVSLEGTIDVSNNTFGGIEVSKGVDAQNPGVLNIGSAKLINSSESYGKPTIWVDGLTDNEGIVNGANELTMVEVNGQKQYYLNKENSINPDAPVKVGDRTFDTLKEAIDKVEGEEIVLQKDIEESPEIVAGKQVVINGNGHVIKGMFKLGVGVNREKGSLKITDATLDGQGKTDWAIVNQRQNEDSGKSSFAVQLVKCNIQNYTKKGIYATELNTLKLAECNFTKCATDEMNEPNTYGDYVVDLNLMGVQDVKVVMNMCKFENNGAKKAAVKVTARGGESDADANDVPKGITTSVAAFGTSNCWFNEPQAEADVRIGTDNKSVESNPDADNQTGNFGHSVISNVETVTRVVTAYDGQEYTLNPGQSFIKNKDEEPTIHEYNTLIDEEGNFSDSKEYSKETLMSMKKEEIQNIANELGVEVTGTKESMADAIVASYNN